MQVCVNMCVDMCVNMRVDMSIHPMEVIGAGAARGAELKALKKRGRAGTDEALQTAQGMCIALLPQHCLSIHIIRTF